MKFSIKDFFHKCDQTRNFLRIWSHLLKKSLMEKFIFCAVLLQNITRNIIRDIYINESRIYSMKHSLREKCPNTELFLVRNFLYSGLNTEIYSVNLHIQSEYRKIWTRNNSVFGHFSRSD